MEHYQIHSTWDEEEKYEYDIYVEHTDAGVEYRMHFSNDQQWSEPVRGKLMQQVTDDGNGYIFKNPINKKSFDYQQGAEMYILLAFINKIDGIFDGKIIHTKKIADI